MFAEHMLHAPLSRVEAPVSGQVPYPTFLMDNKSQSIEQQFRGRQSVLSHPNTSSEEGNSEIGASGSNDGDNNILASVESSTDSFSDGTVSSTNKRKFNKKKHRSKYLIRDCWVLPFENFLNYTCIFENKISIFTILLGI